MLRHEIYSLHVYCGRAASGWQWAARLTRLPGGESLRFTDPEALLVYLQAVVRAVDRVEPRAGTPAGENLPRAGSRGRRVA
jgi:hypothetical protein